jgi:hypothetical protein
MRFRGGPFFACGRRRSRSTYGRARQRLLGRRWVHGGHDLRLFGRRCDVLADGGDVDRRRDGRGVRWFRSFGPRAGPRSKSTRNEVRACGNGGHRRHARHRAAREPGREPRARGERPLARNDGERVRCRELRSRRFVGGPTRNLFLGSPVRSRRSERARCLVDRLLERDGESGHAREAPRRLERDRALDDRLPRSDVDARARGRRPSSVEDELVELGRIRRIVRSPVGEELGEQEPERMDVGPRPVRPPATCSGAA